MSRAAIAAGVGLLLLSAALGQTVLSRWSAEHLVNRLRTCLGGGVALGPGEPGLVRLHRVEAGERLRAGGKPPPGSGASWLDRCSDLVDAAASSRSVKALSPRLAEQAQKASSEPQSGKPTEALGAVLEEAQACVGAKPPAADAPPTGPPLMPVLDAQIEQVRGRCGGLPTIAPGGIDVQPADRLLFEATSTDGARLCSVDGSGALRCEPRPAALAEGRFAGSSDPSQAVFSAPEALLSPRGELLATRPRGQARSDQVFVRASGAVAVLGQSARDLVWSKGPTEVRTPVPARGLLAAGHFLWSAGGKLRARAMLDEAPGLGPERELGPAPSDLRARTCRSRGGWVVAIGDPWAPSTLESTHAPDTAAVVWLYFASDAGAWTEAKKISLGGPPRGNADTLGAWTLACGEGQAQVGWARSSLRGGGEVHELSLARCTPEGCRVEQASVGWLGVEEMYGGSRSVPRPIGLKPPALVPLGASAALLWLDRPFFKARIAPLAQLPQAPTIALAQHDESSGIGVDAGGPRWVHYRSSLDEAATRGGGALLLLRSTQTHRLHFFPFWLDATGARALDCGAEDPGRRAGAAGETSPP